jgi:serine/threonine-protein kinase RsbW
LQGGLPFFLSGYMHKPIILPDGIAIPSSTEYLSTVDSYIEEALARAGIDQSVIADIAISVSELVNNAIKHGNKADQTKTVEVRLHISKAELKVTVQDQGNGFNIDTVPDPIDDNNLMREVGRGIFIVRSFVDEMHVSRGRTGGTCVEIVKKR